MFRIISAEEYYNKHPQLSNRRPTEKQLTDISIWYVYYICIEYKKETSFRELRLEIYIDEVHHAIDQNGLRDDWYDCEIYEPVDNIKDFEYNGIFRSMKLRIRYNELIECDYN